MNQERWSFWRRREEEPAGGESLERSESDSPPATPPSGAGVGEPCHVPDDADQEAEKAVVDPRQGEDHAGTSEESPLSETAAVDYSGVVHAEEIDSLDLPGAEVDASDLTADAESALPSETPIHGEELFADPPVAEEETLPDEVAGLTPDAKTGAGGPLPL